MPGAEALYTELCGWRTERVDAGGSGSYLALELGGLGGGIVECETRRPLWLPYVEVKAVNEVTARARGLGASVLLEPREGPTGWRSVVATDAGAELAFGRRSAEVARPMNPRPTAGLTNYQP